MATALCPGSFDPVTNGHLDIIERTARHFDDVIVAVIRNPQKAQSLFTLEERQEMLAEVTAHLANVRIEFFKGLLVDFAKEHGANAIVKGLRAVSDFDYELQMAQMNQRLSGIDTFFISTSPQYSFLSSSLVREVARFGGDVSSMVPPVVAKRLDRALRRAEPRMTRRERVRERRSSAEAATTSRRSCCSSSRELVESGRSMPMSASVLVNRDEILALVDEASRGCPRSCATRAGCSRSATSSSARPAARPTTSSRRAGCRPSAWSSGPRSSVRPAASRRHVVDDAEAPARRLRHEAEDYIDQKLAAFEVVLERTMQAVQKGRERAAGRHRARARGARGRAD